MLLNEFADSQVVHLKRSDQQWNVQYNFKYSVKKTGNKKLENYKLGEINGINYQKFASVT